MPTPKASTTAVKQVFAVDGEKKPIKVAIELPFFLPLDSLQTCLSEFIESLELARAGYEERTVGRQHPIPYAVEG